MISPIDYIYAVVQITVLFVIRVVAIIVGLVAAIPYVITARPSVNKFNESVIKHKQKYIDEGSSGEWEFYSSPLKWLWWWGNDEDGCLGEPSGRWSASCKGKERSKWNMYKWVALRNPANNLSRYVSLFNCKPKECEVSYKGDLFLSDKGPVVTGWQFVKAENYLTGRNYYGFRCVAKWPDGDVFQIKAGFKIKPEHGNATFSKDSEDKGFTVGIQIKSKAN